MFRKVCQIVTGLSALFVLGGCVIDGSESGANAPIETQTETMAVDLDATSEHALGLVFNMNPIDDRLDYDGGDRADWRYIIVTDPGTITIKMNVDSPAKINGGWKIIDSKGRTLHEQSFRQTESYYEFRDFHVQRGVYFFETYAVSGKSVYTVEAIYKPMQVAIEPPDVPDEPDCTGLPCSRCDGPGCKSSSSTPTTPKPSCKGKPCSECNGKGCVDDREPKQPKQPDPKPADTGGTKVKGFIAVITEKPDGSAEITIRDVGKNKGVETGMVGYIEGTKTKIETTQCFPTSCRALIPASANPKSFKKGANVVFTVK